MFFARRHEAKKRQRIFAHVGVNQEGDLGVQFAERGVR